jgi:hypothetical protein
MKIHGSLTFAPGELRPTGRSFVEASRRPGRPWKHYRLRVRGPEDVEVARSLGLPVYLLTPARAVELGAPTSFRPHLLVAQELDPAVDTDYPRIVIRFGECVRDPRIEDLVVALLSVDPLTARLLAMRNRTFIDPERLACRVIQEGVAAPATRVGLQELARGIPRVGPTWPRGTLEAHDRGHTVTGLRA